MQINRIEKWAEERYLYNQPHNENALIRMLIEEVQEYLDSVNNNDTDGMVDALGDITVFGIGELPRLGAKSDDVFLTYGRDISSWIKQYTPKENPNFTTSENLTYMISDLIGKDTSTKIEVIKKITIYCYYKIQELGYDVDCVMDEILKEIESRTGEYDEKQGKWLKYKTPEAKALWYQANFKNCKK